MPRADPSQPPPRRVRDRHARRTPTTPTNRIGPRTTTGPRATIGPPRVIPMTPTDHDRAVRAWAVLIATWWTDNPPDPSDSA
jgi:hypothetical protein